MGGAKLLILLILLIGGSVMFIDVSPSLNSYEAIEDLKDSGWVVGVGGNQFKPFDTITRAQMAVLILRAEHGPHVSPQAPTGSIPDVPATYWGAKWIEAAINEGLIDLYADGNFYSRNPATRADVAVLIWLLK